MLEPMYSVLLVEDDERLREATQESLTRDGFDVRAAPDGTAGLAEFEARRPHLALLDVMLPHMDGITLCREIRARSVIPIVLLSARSDPIDVVLGLEAGADDYVTKPFEPPILSARLRAVLRRATRMAEGSRMRFGDLEIDPKGMVVTRDGIVLSLTPTEYRLLLELAQNVGIVLSREQLLENVWGYVWSGDTRLVDMHVRRLRGKVGADTIETVRGAGYKLARPG